jgi:putative hydrolase of the HAD superfamily
MDLDWYVRTAESRRSTLPIIVFDGDDTLWATEALYDDARHRSADLVAAVGLDPVRYEKLQQRIDVANFDRYGLSPVRFPTSSREAYEKLAAESGAPVSGSVAEEIYQASARVFDVAAPVDPHAQDTLRKLRDVYRLVVLTKGDVAIQRRRVDDSGLVPLLDAACIVEAKNAAVFTATLRELRSDPRSSWSVGNSYGSDVVPAVAAGMRAVWIDAHVWAHERSLSELDLVGHEPNVFVADGLNEVPAILERTPPRRVEP